MENCVFRWFWLCTRKGFWLKWLYAFLIPAVSYCVVAELWLSAGSTYFLSCWETLLESSANFGELWGIVMLKELLGFEVPEGCFFFSVPWKDISKLKKCNWSYFWGLCCHEFKLQRMHCKCGLFALCWRGAICCLFELDSSTLIAKLGRIWWWSSL